METAKAIKQIYLDAKKFEDSQDSYRPKSKFLEIFQQRVFSYIWNLDHPKKIDGDKLQSKLTTLAVGAKNNKRPTKQYLQSIVDFIEELKNNPISDIYEDPTQNELF